MKILRKTSNLNENDFVGITIGSFDGVHLGHLSLLKNFKEKCFAKNIKPLVITFNPHPLIVLCGKENFLIQAPKDKFQKLKSLELEVCEVEFSVELSKLDGDDFFNLLKNKFPNLKYFHAGHDFGLGVNKCINYELAKNILSDIETFQDKQLLYNSEEISSSLIRSLIEKGRVEKANTYLNSEFSISGTVVEGNKIGRKLGFRTANLKISNEILKPDIGVYWGLTSINNIQYRVVLNCGLRPSIVEDQKVKNIEVHVLEFDDDIYHEELQVRICGKLRDEKKFKSKEDLINQINQDIITTKDKIFYGSFALIGQSISHSKSKDTYAKLLNNNFLNYSLLDFYACSDIPELDTLKENYDFISVTAPFKEYLFSKVDLIEDCNIKYKSINAIKFVNGKSIGTNTDLLAIIDILQEYSCAGINEVLLLGDGAMAKLIISVNNKHQEFKITQFSRKLKNLEQLNQQLKENILIINTCARDYKLEVEPSSITHIWDFNYSQDYESDLIKNKLIKYTNGLSLLTLQAKYALSFWNLKKF